jgi:hypothetical protein
MKKMTDDENETSSSSSPPLLFDDNVLINQHSLLRPTTTVVSSIVWDSGLTKSELIASLEKMHADAVSACETYSQESCAFIFDDYKRLKLCLQPFERDPDVIAMLEKHARRMARLNETLIERTRLDNERRDRIRLLQENTNNNNDALNDNSLNLSENEIQTQEQTTDNNNNEKSDSDRRRRRNSDDSRLNCLLL